MGNKELNESWHRQTWTTFFCIYLSNQIPVAAGVFSNCKESHHRWRKLTDIIHTHIFTSPSQSDCSRSKLYSNCLETGCLPPANLCNHQTTRQLPIFKDVAFLFLVYCDWAIRGKTQLSSEVKVWTISITMFVHP